MEPRCCKENNNRKSSCMTKFGLGMVGLLITWGEYSACTTVFYWHFLLRTDFKSLPLMLYPKVFYGLVFTIICAENVNAGLVWWGGGDINRNGLWSNPPIWKRRMSILDALAKHSNALSHSTHFVDTLTAAMDGFMDQMYLVDIDLPWLLPHHCMFFFFFFIAQP